jgi:hypothetical protein
MQQNITNIRQTFEESGIFSDLARDFKKTRLDPKKIGEAKSWYTKFTGTPCHLSDQEILEIYDLLQDIA